MTKPLQQLRITQLMGRGAETLIVPDTNTAAPLLCIPICTSLPGRGQLSYRDARAALRAHRARIVARWLGLLTAPGCSHPAEGRPSLLRLSASCCAAAGLRRAGPGRAGGSGSLGMVPAPSGGSAGPARAGGERGGSLGNSAVLPPTSECRFAAEKPLQHCSASAESPRNNLRDS